MNKYTGLWIGKTGEGNAWYHIYPFVFSKYNSHLHVVRYKKPQNNIISENLSYYTFKNNNLLIEVLNLFRTGIKVILKNKIDYIVSFNLFPWGIFGFIISRLFNKKFILGLIGSDYNFFIKNKLLRNVLIIILEKSTLVTIPGNSMKKSIVESKINIRNLEIFPHCLSENWFNYNEGRINTEYDVISVSTLTYNKRIDDIIKAIKILKDKELHIRYAVLGQGLEKTHLLQHTKELGVEDRIIFLGYHKNVKDFLLKSKIFIQASMTEGLSLSLIEAIGVGLVPIVTRAGSEEDLIKNDFNGLFIKKFSPEDIAKKISFALKEENYVRLRQNILNTRKDLKIEKAINAVDKIITIIMNEK